jgi:hypothetical protein
MSARKDVRAAVAASLLVLITQSINAPHPVKFALCTPTVPCGIDQMW